METLKDMLSRSSTNGHLFPLGPCLGNMEGTLLDQGLQEEGEVVSELFNGESEICKRRLWKRATLSKGAPLGNLKGGSFTGSSGETDEGGHWKWSISLYGSSVRGTWKEGSFTRYPEGYVKEGSGNGHLSP